MYLFLLISEGISSLSPLRSLLLLSVPKCFCNIQISSIDIAMNGIRSSFLYRATILSCGGGSGDLLYALVGSATSRI